MFYTYTQEYNIEYNINNIRVYIVWSLNIFLHYL